jgi:hypothetical protein
MIYNIQGIGVKKGLISQGSFIDTHDLMSGVYFLKLSQGLGTNTMVTFIRK